MKNRLKLWIFMGIITISSSLYSSKLTNNNMIDAICEHKQNGTEDDIAQAAAYTKWNNKLLEFEPNIKNIQNNNQLKLEFITICNEAINELEQYADLQTTCHAIAQAKQKVKNCNKKSCCLIS